MGAVGTDIFSADAAHAGRRKSALWGRIPRDNTAKKVLGRLCKAQEVLRWGKSLGVGRKFSDAGKARIFRLEECRQLSLEPVKSPAALAGACYDRNAQPFAQKSGIYMEPRLFRLVHKIHQYDNGACHLEYAECQRKASFQA